MVQPKAATTKAPGLGSRTNSSQSSSKKSTSKLRAPTALPATPSKPPTKKSVSLTKKTTKRTRSSFASKLFLPLLLLFSVYALVVCPTDYQENSVVCRGLATYRTQVMDPMLDAVTPIAVDVARTARQAVDTWVEKGRGTEAGRKVANVVVPVYDKASVVYTKVVVPYYTRVIVPTYNRVVLPTYRRVVLPVVIPAYRKVVVFVQTNVVPYFASRVDPYTRKVTRMVGPYTDKARVVLDKAGIVWSYAQVKVGNAWNYTQVKARAYYPKLVTAWTIARPHVVRALALAKDAIERVAKEAGVARRRWVDPHLRVMWAKVIEVGGKKPTEAIVTPITTPVLSSVDEETTPADPTLEQYTATSSTATELEETQLPTPVLVQPSSTQAEAEAGTDVPESTSGGFISDELAEALSISAEAARAAESAAAAERAASPAHVEEAEPVPEAGFISDELAPELSISAESVFAASSSSSATVEESSIPDFSEEEDDDIDAFLAALGITSSSSTGTTSSATEDPSSSSVPPARQTLDAAAVAAKRAKIKERHEEHFNKITARADELAPQIRQSLVDVREHAVRELTEENGGLSKALKSECDSRLAGLEGYLAREQKKAAAGSDLASRADRFATVLQRVRDSFAAITDEYQSKVIGIAQRARDEEVSLCLRAGEEVKKLAERAQTDLGLDYAWLEDVTYDDWQEYHLLMGVYKDFRDQIKLIQENMHERPVPDPLQNALPALQEEMRGVVAVCQAKIADVEERAKKVFLPAGEKEEATVLKSDPSAFIGRGKEEVEKALSGIPLEHTTTEDASSTPLAQVDGSEPTPLAGAGEKADQVEAAEPTLRIQPVDEPALVEERKEAVVDLPPIPSADIQNEEKVTEEESTYSILPVGEPVVSVMPEARGRDEL